MRYSEGQYNTIPKPTISLDEIKKNKIHESKALLQEHLKENPLLSYAKYAEGRFYTITPEKQQQLTAKLFLATTKALNNDLYELSWNDTGNVCEPWTMQELSQLSDEIDRHITALVTKQQYLEVAIRNATTLKELEGIVINYED